MKAIESRVHWDVKYEQGLPSLTKPDPFFVSAYEKFVHPSFSNGGVALDLAGGLGRHALYLAKRKWRVTVVDISTVALRKLKQSADEANLELSLCAFDSAEYDFGLRRSDLIVVFYHADRGLLPKIVSALSVGGFVICKLAVRWDSESAETTTGENPLEKGELASLFPDLQVLDHHERPVRGRGVVEVVGKRIR